MRCDDADIDPAIAICVDGLEQENLRLVERRIQRKIEEQGSGAFDLHVGEALAETKFIAFTKAEHDALGGAGSNAYAVTQRAINAPGDVAEFGRNGGGGLSPAQRAGDAIEAFPLGGAALGNCGRRR